LLAVGLCIAPVSTMMQPVSVPDAISVCNYNQITTNTKHSAFFNCFLQILDVTAVLLIFY